MIINIIIAIINTVRLDILLFFDFFTFLSFLFLSDIFFGDNVLFEFDFVISISWILKQCFCPIGTTVPSYELSDGLNSVRGDALPPHESYKSNVKWGKDITSWASSRVVSCELSRLLEFPTLGFLNSRILKV